jgi:hypothetical protein
MPIILSGSTATHTTTAGNIVNGALRLLRVKPTDVTLDAEDMQIGLQVLNEMLDSWAVEQLLLYQVVRETFSLSAGHNPHTWGAGGDFNSARPIEIVAASISVGSTPSVDIPLQSISYDAYEAVRLKSLVTNYPREYYNDNAYPLSNIYLYPIPAGSKINFQSYKALTLFDFPETIVTLPQGYVRALRFNLAVELAPEYQVDVEPTIQMIATTTVGKLKSLNYRPTMALIDPGLVKIGRGGGRYNPFSDQRG